MKFAVTYVMVTAEFTFTCTQLNNCKQDEVTIHKFKFTRNQ